MVAVPDGFIGEAVFVCTGAHGAEPHTRTPLGDLRVVDRLLFPNTRTYPATAARVVGDCVWIDGDPLIEPGTVHVRCNRCRKPGRHKQWPLDEARAIVYRAVTAGLTECDISLF